MDLRRPRANPRFYIGALLLTIQLGWIAYVHLRPLPSASYASSVFGGCSAHPIGCWRYFAWAPNDYAVEYRLKVIANGRRLTPSQALALFRLSTKKVFEDPPQRLIDTIRAYERAYRRHDHDQVVLVFHVNRHESGTWRWP